MHMRNCATQVMYNNSILENGSQGAGSHFKAMHAVGVGQLKKIDRHELAARVVGRSQETVNGVAPVQRPAPKATNVVTEQPSLFTGDSSHSFARGHLVLPFGDATKSVFGKIHVEFREELEVIWDKGEWCIRGWQNAREG